MAELLDWDGVWSEDLVLMTLNVLAEIEADEMVRHQQAVTAGIAGAFQKNGAKAFTEIMSRVKLESRKERGAKGKKDPEQGRTATKTMMGIFGQMGLSTRRKR